MIDALTICNGCDAAPADPAPAGYCTDCERIARDPSSTIPLRTAAFIRGAVPTLPGECPMNEDAAERICWHIYGTDTVALALKQGWTDAVRHLEALRANNADRVAFTHPYNYLTEAQVEAIG